MEIGRRHPIQTLDPELKAYKSGILVVLVNNKVYHADLHLDNQVDPSVDKVIKEAKLANHLSGIYIIARLLDVSNQGRSRND